MPITRRSGINRATTSTEPATERQIEFMRNLANQRYVFGESITPEDSLSMIEASVTAGITKTQASTIIESFLQAPARPGTRENTRDQERLAYENRPAAGYALSNLRDAARRRAVFGDQHTVDETIAMMEARINDGLTNGQARELRQQAWAAPAHRTPDDPIFLDDLYAADASLPMIENGYYALEQADAVRFYRVWSPSTGRFANRRLIARYSSDRADVLYRDEAVATVTAIAVDPLEAATRFARLETRCYRCGKRLTDHLSRLLLVGPDCRQFAATGVLRPLRNLPDTEENQNKFTAFLRACREASEHESLQEGMREAAEWFAALPADQPLETAVTRLTALLEGGYTPENTRENPELWTVDEQRLTAFAALRELFPN